MAPRLDPLTKNRGVWVCYNWYGFRDPESLHLNPHSQGVRFLMMASGKKPPDIANEVKGRQKSGGRWWGGGAERGRGWVGGIEGRMVSCMLLDDVEI